MKKITILICLLISETFLAQSTAIYDISVTTIWNAEQHTALPDGAHWSPLAGATHNMPNTVLELNAPAPNSNGIKDIAEFGGTANFENEIRSLIFRGDADQFLRQSFSPFAGNASTATINNVTVSESFPLITLVSMVAPSPDWFIAAHNINLRSETPNNNNGWKETFVMDLFAYDAGTDSGTDYNSENSSTSPRANISLISDGPIMGNRMATITFTFKSFTLSNADNLQDPLDTYLSPNPAKGDVTFSNLQRVKRIDIFSVLGKLTKSIALVTPKNKLRLNISDFNAGVYIVRLTDNSGATSKRKLIVN